MRIEAVGLQKTIQRLEKEQETRKEKLHELMERLAKIGVSVAKYSFDRALYAGLNDVSVQFEWESDNRVAVKASGYHVMFIEFGSGIRYGEHPQSAEMGFAHGTYGHKQGANPSGWVYEGYPGQNPPADTDYVVTKNGKQKYGKTGNPLVRTKGNPPSMSMFAAGREMRDQIERIVREVFR